MCVSLILTKSQPLECLSGFGQFSEFLSQDKTLDAQAVGLHVGRPVYTLHIKVESLQAEIHELLKNLRSADL